MRRKNLPTDHPADHLAAPEIHGREHPNRVAAIFRNRWPSHAEICRELLKGAIERKDWKSSANIMDCIEEMEGVFHDYKNYCVQVGERPTNDLLKIWPSFADFRFNFNLDAFNTAWYQVVPDAWLAKKMKTLKKEMAVIASVLDKITVSDV